ncbi:MAG: glucose-6-phosphate isomerase [Gammaproteobacteria bacterium]|nr:glucose-6-phosphate isomerase [Gammaproteobacteria bacterium]
MNRASETDVWEALSVNQKQLVDSNTTISDLLADDSPRNRLMHLTCGGILADFSKHLVNADSLALLYRLAHKKQLAGKIRALFDGTCVNNTENRPALHTALRGHVPVTMPDVAKTVADTLDKISQFVERVQTGSWTGFSGQPIRTVVNIGIGGSDLGPAMACEALSGLHNKTLRCLFVSNVDPSHLRRTLATVDVTTTLFIVASKSFTTLETLSNAQLARQWYLDSGGREADIHRHFVAVSSNVAAASEFGIHQDNIFPMWDWVGGRYSLWSAIGLSIALATSMQVFNELLAGARDMDLHFLQAPLDQNMPVRMALLAVWYRNFWRCDSHVVLPYAQDLHLLPSFLQQLEMESLGKAVTAHGSPVTSDTGAVIWGSAGTNGQHSFHQLLHQGTRMIPADFIAAARSYWPQDTAQYHHLLANCLAQSRALMTGKSNAEALAENLKKGLSAEQATMLAPHREVAGNRPSTTLILEQLDGRNLGALIALYEHKVFVQSVIWGINAFDQWGVEIGKELSGPMFRAIEGDESSFAALDASSQLLIKHIRSLDDSSKVTDHT